jgi:hypothetical protein
LGGTQWQPERSPEGPLSIVVSGADRRVVVLRNGREIGSAPVSLDALLTETRAYMLRTDDQGHRVWFTITPPAEGKAPKDAEPDWSGLHVDPQFRTSVATVLAPGTTVVLTPDSLVTGAAPVEILDSGASSR